jgi:FkbM family methyltransferase
VKVPMQIRRKDFLIGLGGMAVGAPAGALAYGPLTESVETGVPSYSQGGEDLAVSFFFEYCGIGDITYLDIGAYDPVKINNTYSFYRRGCRGVLVEPNVTMCERLRAVRPRDTTLAAGIGFGAAKEADYYVLADPSWNTFSKEEAERRAVITNGTTRILRVVKVPLLNINDVMAEHFGGKAPAFVSIDTEGLDLAILKTIEFRRFRPRAFCVETTPTGSRGIVAETSEYMQTQGYVARGGSFVNTIFVDSTIL